MDGGGVQSRICIMHGVVYCNLHMTLCVHVQVDDFLQAIKVYIRMIQLACGDRNDSSLHQ